MSDAVSPPPPVTERFLPRKIKSLFFYWHAVSTEETSWASPKRADSRLFSSSEYPFFKEVDSSTSLIPFFSGFLVKEFPVTRSSLDFPSFLPHAKDALFF